MHIVYDSGAVLDVQMVLAKNAETIEAFVSAETVPSFRSTPNANCTGFCAIRVQVSLDGQKTRDRERRH
ncbi:hypothetical protein CBA19CS11_30720 [Caballeronia novacaledonica]|nr:hypothetical protein CBA19CS11_30720 [Caballeronia novacaledonica]